MSSFNLFKATAFIFALFFQSALGVPLEHSRRSQFNCENITIPVTVSAVDAYIPPGTTIALLPALLDLGLTFNVSVHGTFNIAATFCNPQEPNDFPDRINTLQVLIHGGTYTRTYWSGDGAPGYGYDGNTYSWVAYATALGYPVLFIDRLGNGLSDHPDPLLVAQVPTNIETVHAIIDLARAGTLPLKSLNRAFSKIILVGHSIGSLVSNPLTAKYPNDADAVVLTGFSNDLMFSQILSFGLEPADIAQPARYGNLAPGYLEGTNEAGITTAFWWPGGYDPAFAAYDYSIRGTIPLGEGATVAVATTVATAYKNPVYVISGEHDEIFCAQLLGAPSCDPNGSTPSILAQTQSLYPNARVYDWYSVPNCGHDWQFHYNNQLGFAAVHTWLQGVGF